MTDYCCSEDHAVMTAKYLLSIRDRVTHTVSSRQHPRGSIWHRPVHQSYDTGKPYQAANNGVVEDDGTLVMSTAVEDNTYPIWYFRLGSRHSR